MYKPTSKLMQMIEEEKTKEVSQTILPTPSSIHKKPQVHVQVSSVCVKAMLQLYKTVNFTEEKRHREKEEHIRIIQGRTQKVSMCTCTCMTLYSCFIVSTRYHKCFLKGCCIFCQISCCNCCIHAVCEDVQYDMCCAFH